MKRTRNPSIASYFSAKFVGLRTLMCVMRGFDRGGSLLATALLLSLLPDGFLA